MTKTATPPTQRLIQAYRDMLDRAAAMVARAKHRGVGSVVFDAVEQTKEQMSTLQELTREEATQIGDYLLRDIHDAAEFMAEHGHELKDWLRLDTALVEDKLVQLIAVMTDQTRLELDKLAVRAAKFGAWHAGEIVGAGTLYCKACGEILQFHRISHIPPCPKCHGTVFGRRIEGEGA